MFNKFNFREVFLLVLMTNLDTRFDYLLLKIMLPIISYDFYSKLTANIEIDKI